MPANLADTVGKANLSAFRLGLFAARALEANVRNLVAVTAVAMLIFSKVGPFHALEQRSLCLLHTRKPQRVTKPKLGLKPIARTAQTRTK